MAHEASFISFENLRSLAKVPKIFLIQLTTQKNCYPCLQNFLHCICQFWFSSQAGLSGLEQCPFCPFATIMDVPKEVNKLFACQNPECGKESCRLCREDSHIPLRCEEVEKDDEVRMRTYIENKMAEAMIRNCYSCKRPYIKQVQSGVLLQI